MIQWLTKKKQRIVRAEENQDFRVSENGEEREDEQLKEHWDDPSRSLTIRWCVVEESEEN